ncbi:MAG: stage V sporulation protein AA [Lachnospiraceae bacterium]|nr:stage V sporulation protein AA [Lachnospiraceae bacterium]
MERVTLYFALEQSILVASRKVHIEDIATIYCRNKDFYHQVAKLEVTTMPDGEQSQVVVTAMKIIQLISNLSDKIHIESIGNPETIIYYKNLKDGSKTKSKLKAVFLMVLAFIGTGYSIMTYNEEVNTRDLLFNIYELFTKESATANNIHVNLGLIAYSVGLTLGMIIFFNHGINRKNTDDPTPLQVQMRLYEQEVNECIIIDNTREKKTIDAS